MKKIIILTGELADRFTVSRALLTTKAASKQLSLYGNFEQILTETFQTPISRTTPMNLAISSVTENHLRKFFGKFGRGLHSITNFVDKPVATTDDVLNYFVNKVGAHCFGSDFLFADLVKSFINEPAGVYLVSDVSDEEAKKIKSLLPNQTTVVQIVGSGEQAAEGNVPLDMKKTDRALNKSITEALENIKNQWKGITNEQRNA